MSVVVEQGVDEPGRIVIVDDEDMVLVALSSFLALETRHEVLTFSRAQAALDFIDQNDVDMIISDFLMPEI